MRSIALNMPQFSIVPLLAVITSLSIYPIQSVQAQSCENLQGNLEVMPGDTAQLHQETTEQPINLLSGADSNANTLYSGLPGELITIRTEAVHQSSCYRWLYVEMQSSGTQGWVRADQVRNTPLQK